MLKCISGALHNNLYVTGGLPQTEGSEVQQQGTVQAGGGRSPRVHSYTHTGVGVNS